MGNVQNRPGRCDNKKEASHAARGDTVLRQGTLLFPDQVSGRHCFTAGRPFDTGQNVVLPFPSINGNDCQRGGYQQNRMTGSQTHSGPGAGTARCDKKQINEAKARGHRVEVMRARAFASAAPDRRGRAATERSCGNNHEAANRVVIKGKKEVGAEGSPPENGET